MINSLVLSREHEQPAMRPTEELYRDPNGLISHCGHCRRVQRVRQPSQWDWVPEWVAQPPPRTSHSLCYVCYEYFYHFYRPGLPKH